TRHSRGWPLFQCSAILLAVIAVAGCSQRAEKPTASRQAGRELIATLRSSPATFNRLMGSERALDLISRLTYGQLVRINRATWDVEPWLAESWTRSDDGLRYTLKLRPNLVFSDGHPFTAADVLFSFEAVYDEKTASPISETLRV